MRAVVARVEQQHNRDRHQCNGSNKDTKHCTHSSPTRIVTNRRGSPRRGISGGFFDRQLGTSANSTILLAQSRHKIMCGMWQRWVASVILFRLKAAGRQLASVPIGSSRRFDRLCFGLHIRNQFINLSTVQRALNAQHDGQCHHHVAEGHQQVTCSNIAMCDERLDGILARADQHCQLARLPEIIDRLNRFAVQ